MPKAPDKRGIVNGSSKWQVERLPVDDNDDASLEDVRATPKSNSVDNVRALQGDATVLE